MSNKSTDTRPPFFMVEDAVIEHYNLNPFEGWLYIVIVKHANRKTGEAFPSVSTLVKETHMSKASVIRYTKSLETKGLIRVTRDENEAGKDRDVNHYWLLTATTPVSDSNRVGISQQPPPVSVVDLNQSNIEPESINQRKEDNIATDIASKELSEVKPPKSDSLPQEPKAVDPEPPPTFAAPPPVVDTIAAGIKAYIDGLITPPASNQYGNTTNRKAVKCIIDAGFTAEQITHYTKAIQAQDYWKGKKPPLTMIADGIAAYYAQHAPKILILPEMETPPVEPPDVPRGLAAGIDPELVKQMIEDLALAKAV